MFSFYFFAPLFRKIPFYKRITENSDCKQASLLKRVQKYSLLSYKPNFITFFFCYYSDFIPKLLTQNCFITKLFFIKIQSHDLITLFSALRRAVYSSLVPFIPPFWLNKQNFSVVLLRNFPK
jgi:hypothetical protein